MAPRMVFEFLLYIALLAGALMFCVQSFQDYWMGKRSYADSKEPISLIDLPAITICQHPLKSKRLVYGQNVLIDARVWEKDEKKVRLQENRSVKTLFGLGLHLSELKPMWTPKTSSRMQYQCYRISPEYRGNEDIDMQSFRIQLHINYIDIKVNGYWTNRRQMV